MPICAHHDPTKWHGLVEYDPVTGAILCTYAHTHMDNPHAVDNVFGPPPLSQEISYPWQTQNAVTGAYENQAKHRVYDWAVIQNAQCVALGEQYSFTNGRLEAHLDGNSGATVRFHSYWFEVEGCDPADPSWHGTLSMGGHMDTGILFSGNTYVPLPNDPPCGANCQNTRLHGAPGFIRYDFTWYGNNLSVRNGPVGLPIIIGSRKEDWGPVDPNNAGATLFYGGNQNGSFNEPWHILGVHVPPELDTNRTGLVTYDGFVDRYGSVVPACAPLGPDCIPLHIKNMKVGGYQFRNDQHIGIGTREYDIRISGMSLIQFPN